MKCLIRESDREYYPGVKAAGLQIPAIPRPSEANGIIFTVFLKPAGKPCSNLCKYHSILVDEKFKCRCVYPILSSLQVAHHL